MLSAPTGIVAKLINGFTMHSLTFMAWDAKQMKEQDLIDLWQGVDYLIINEVSMVLVELLGQISKRLTVMNCLFDNPKSSRFFLRLHNEEEWNNGLNCMRIQESDIVVGVV